VRDHDHHNSSHAGVAHDAGSSNAGRRTLVEASAAPQRMPSLQLGVGARSPWDVMFRGAPSSEVHRVGRIQAERGVRLRQAPSPDGATITIIPFNSEIMVQRETTEPAEHDRWCYVAGAAGAGFCERQYVTTDLPEASAQLYLVQSGDTLGGIAEHRYGQFIESGNDARLYVHALYLVNKHRTGVFLGDGGLTWAESLIRGKSERETLEIYKRVQVVAGNALWMPSNAFIQLLDQHHAITSGQTVVTQAWEAAKDEVAEAIDDVKYASAVVAGLVEGAGKAVWDMFQGAVQMVHAVYDIVVKLVTGDIGGLVGMARGWIGKLAALWQDRNRIREGFLGKWNAHDSWERGKFRGEVIGWVAMTVLLMVITGGEAAAGIVAVLAARFPALVEGLQLLGRLGDATTYAQKVGQGAQHLGDAAEDVIRARARDAQRRRDRRRGGGDDHGPDRGPERGGPDRRDDDDRPPVPPALALAGKIRRATRIAKLKIAQTGVSTEDWELVKASHDFASAAHDRAEQEDLDAFALQPRDSPGDCRRVVIMPGAMTALAARARAAGASADAIEALATGRRDQVRVDGELHGDAFQINLRVVYNGPH
jgi:hypothetical protein